jgi:hypothetical protein
MTDTTQKTKKPTSADRTREQLAEIMGRLRSCSELTRMVKGPLPPMLVAALASGRPELVAACVNADATPETRAIFAVIEALLETNAALQMHAREVSLRLEQMEDQTRGVLMAMRRIGAFADFRNADDDEVL